MFKAENWDPARLAGPVPGRPGRAISCLVAEHHDGFPMYATNLTPTNAAVMGPCRDVVGRAGRRCARRRIKVRRLFAPGL